MARSSRVVPGHPFEGAFYWLMSAENWRQSSIKSPYEGSHPYYKTLYGKEPHRLIDATASMVLLYDQVLLAPADCPLPDWQRCTVGSRYENKELGLTSDWEWMPRSDEFEQRVAAIMEDVEKNHTLDKIPARVWPQIVRGIVAQLGIAHRFKADMLGNHRYLRLCSRIQKITGEFKNAGFPEDVDRLPASLSSAFRLSRLKFALGGIDEFVALRTDKRIIQYGTAFRKHVASLPDGADTENELYRAMLDALDATDVGNQIVGGLEMSAQACSYASLIPIVGTVAGGVGMVADHAAKGARKLTERTRWWMLAPRLSELLTRTRLRKKLARDQ